jgi:hypothetical protein
MKLGGTDRDVADALQLDECTINRWKVKHPKFCKSITVGKGPANKRVEVSLFRKATGYSFDSEKIFVIDDQVVRVPTVEHVPPSDRAIEYWLNNRKRKEWRHTSHLELANSKKRPVGQTYTPAMPELLGEFYAKLEQSRVAAGADPDPASDLGRGGPEGDELGEDTGSEPR